MRHGQVVAEGRWRPYRPESPQMMYSLSKSFTSTAVGFAVAEKRLGVHDRVITFFPQDLPSERASAAWISPAAARDTGYLNCSA